MSELYLVAHKVRGEASFDIAQRLRCPICQGIGCAGLPDFETGIPNDYEGHACVECDGEGYWWIIPTSGHRAYPYWTFPLQSYDKDCLLVRAFGDDAICQMPQDWPDHYPTSASPATPRQSLAERLGIKRPQAPTITRRL